MSFTACSTFEPYLLMGIAILSSVWVLLTGTDAFLLVIEGGKGRRRRIA